MLLQPQFLQPQFLLYLLSQPYLVNYVLGLQKPRKEGVTGSSRCPPLEQQMVEITVAAMELAPQAENLADVFRNIASDLIFFVLFQFVSFPYVITDLEMQC